MVKARGQSALISGVVASAGTTHTHARARAFFSARGRGRGGGDGTCVEGNGVEAEHANGMDERRRLAFEQTVLPVRRQHVLHTTKRE